MDTLYEWLVAWHATSPSPKSLLAGSLVAVTCSVIGCFIILRRMAFLGDAIAHAMLAGVVAGYLLIEVTGITIFGENRAPALLLGSVLAGLVTVGLIGFVSKVSRIKDDTAIGIMYTGIFAFGGVLASLYSHRIHVDLYHFVVGTVLAVDTSELWLMAIVAAFVLSVVILFFRHFQIATFDPVMAASLGISVVALDYLLTTCTSLVVVSAVSIVGVILVVGLLVTPAATAYLLCDKLSSMLVVAAIFGETSVVAGLYLSKWMNVASGSAIVVVSTLQFLVVLAVAPRYGLIADWLRRRNMVPQAVWEDVLSAIDRSPDKQLPLADVPRFVHSPADLIERAVNYLQNQGLVALKSGVLELSDRGALEARRILRAHRLWEAYLARRGTPVEELHDTAHRLEHLHDEETVDYIDDILGHPIQDPHGSPIPEDFVHLVPAQEIKAALLREGMRAIVVKAGPAARKVGMRVGMKLRAGPRRNGGQTWTFIVPGDIEMALGHEAADDLLVVLDEE